MLKTSKLKSQAINHITYLNVIFYNHITYLILIFYNYMAVNIVEYGLIEYLPIFMVLAIFIFSIALCNLSSLYQGILLKTLKSSTSNQIHKISLRLSHLCLYWFHQHYTSPIYFLIATMLFNNIQQSCFTISIGILKV